MHNCLKLLVLLVPLASVEIALADDSPKAAMSRLMESLARQDAAAILNQCAVDTLEQKPLAEATANMLVAGRALSDAATRRFGPAADSLARGAIAAGDAGQVDQATISVNDDTAELLMPGNTLPVRFVLRGGVWKLKVVDFAGSQPRDLAKQTALVQMFATAMSDVAAEIEQDRFAHVADAEAAIRQKLNFVLMKSLSPTTAPATRAG